MSIRPAGRHASVAGASAMAMILSLTFALAPVSRVDSQPVRGRIISDVATVEQPDRTDLNIMFTFPVRYIRHFPEDYGDTVEIQLKDIMVSEIDADLLRRRESVRLPKLSTVPLLDISYEGDLPGGPYLTIRFLASVAFAVKQGSDFRSLTVSVFNNHPDSD